MMEFVVICLDQQLCDVGLWIQDYKVNATIIQVFTLAQTTTHSYQIHCVIEPADFAWR